VKKTLSIERSISKRSSLLELSVQRRLICELETPFAVNFEGGAGGDCTVVALAALE
jgi:hypothetical protein